ncbi:hypothetical protein LWM68_18945 [Niabella sp. W65]|nr:hypothetical protein [Niabella sp. W65]MCH7364651.1 hypothetical protein [Niabella sp. W65]
MAQVNQYPYEWSFNKIPMNETLSVDLVFKDENEKTVTKHIVFNEKD